MSLLPQTSRPQALEGKKDRGQVGTGTVDPGDVSEAQGERTPRAGRLGDGSFSLISTNVWGYFQEVE